jgi:hypothetical protein
VARTAFLKRVESEAPQVVRRVKASFSQPTVVTISSKGEPDDSIRQIVLGLAGNDARVFDDVKLDVMTSR